MTVESLKRRIEHLLQTHGTCPSCGGVEPGDKERAWLRRHAEPPEHGRPPYFGNPCIACRGRTVLPKGQPPAFEFRSRA
jgi:hypothetical protein